MVERVRYVLPAVVVPIPLNAEGQGPSEPKDTRRTVFEVWDQQMISICSCPDARRAHLVANAINFMRSTNGTEH